MSLTGERLRIPFPQSPPPQNDRSGRDSVIPNFPLLGSLLGSTRQYPALRPYESSRSLILVRDPPRERLAAAYHEEPRVVLPHEGKPDFVHPNYLPARTDSVDDLLHYYHDQQNTVATPPNAYPESRGRIPHTAAMSKKRQSSLQAILVPSFLQGTPSAPTSPTSPIALTARMRTLSTATTVFPRTSTSSSVSQAHQDQSRPVDKHTRKRSMTFSSASTRVSPPPDFLLDDDPFANLTSAPSESESWRNVPAPGSAAHEALPPPTIPRSPLIDPNANSAVMTTFSAVTSPPASPLPRTRPAHQRPAFQSRPSLPSLSTLARMNVVLTKKVRKGRVGAGLPFEPWDNLPSDDESAPSTHGPLRQQTTPGTPLPPFISPLPHAAPTAQADDVQSSPQTPVGTPMANPQPLLPSQILALGSIAANVEMIIPVSPSRSRSRPSTPLYSQTRLSPTYKVDSVEERDIPPAAAAQSPEITVEDADAQPAHPTPIIDIVPFSRSTEQWGESSNTAEDATESVERLPQSSRNGSDDDHAEAVAEFSASLAIDVLPTFHEKLADDVDMEPTPSVVLEFVEEDDFTLEKTAAYGNEDDEVFEELEDMTFAENESFSCLDLPNRDEPDFFHPGSMLFSSPPSSFSLSGSLSSASRSSRASSDYMGSTEYVENEDGEPVVFGTTSPRKDQKYMRLVNPSLSSLELNLEQSLGLGSEHDEQETGNSTRSSSGRPSLSRTRSSSDYSSDVVRSPLLEDYAFFPQRNLQSPALQHLAASFAQHSVPVTENSSQPFSSDGGRYNEVVGASWTNLFGEYQSGMIGEGLGFGYDRVILAAEGIEAKTGHDDAGDESLTIDTSPSVDQPVITSETASDVNLSPSQVSDDQHQPAIRVQSLIVQQVTPPPTPSLSQFQLSPSQDEMPWPSSSNSRPSSAIRTSITHEMGDLGRAHASYGGQGSSSSSAVYRGNGTSASDIASSYRRAYGSISSRGYVGQGRRNGEDDEDEDERGRRRGALERGHGVETVTKEESSEDESSEDGSEDHYTSAASSLSSRIDMPQRARMPLSPSRSPETYASPVASGSNVKGGYAQFPHFRGNSHPVSDDDSEDDDVPLAKAIPGALTAQKTIRRQVREERKREKSQVVESQRDRQATLRPAGAGGGAGGGDPTSSSSRDAAAMAAAAVLSSQSQTRQRTNTLPGKVANPAILNPHDLARKLQRVQLTDAASPIYPTHGYQLPQSPPNLVSPPSYASKPTLTHSKSYSRPSDSPHAIHSSPPQTFTSVTSPVTLSRNISKRTTPFTSPTGTSQPPLPTLRPMRSFHRPSDRNPSEIDDVRSLAVPADEEHRGSRTSATSVTPTRGSHEPQHSRAMSLSRRSNDRDRPERTISAEPVPALPTTVRRSQEEQRKIAQAIPEQRPVTAPRISAEAERAPRAGNLLPPGRALVTQQRVFVGNLQQFHMVEIGPNTTAGDVVSLMESQGALVGWAGMGGWMVFEIAQDFGMERPIRSYELLMDIQSSWLKDKTVNYFMLKLTPLAAVLTRSAIPSSSPTHSGYIEWESKRGKWSKRWVQLKEHNIYLGKRDNGKDEVVICSLSNFDAYQVTRPYRAPKPFTFCVKSTDKLSFFENTDDYMHTFSCSEKDGKIWMEKILIARSYVLYQERNILFGSKTNAVSGTPAASTGLSRSGTRKTSNAAGGSTALSRSGTRKSPSSAPRSIGQPLVNLPPFSLASAAHSLPHSDVFEPGSLLSRQT